MSILKSISKDNKIYGIPLDDLSYQQSKRTIEFALKVQPWLEENIGTFGQKWTVELDKTHDSLRLIFINESDETYFKLAWMQRDHEPN